jgi:hypothetical protein
VSDILTFESRGETDGTVIRWYLKTTPNERERIATASRWHVRFDRDDIPARVFDNAHAAHRELHANPDADIRHYLTLAAEVTT